MICLLTRDSIGYLVYIPSCLLWVATATGFVPQSPRPHAEYMYVIGVHQLGVS